ncbi:hypothetical protein [Halomonas sp. KRD171]|uniref:hypothetical protein n=1 Tax=Halomonas sp. KRD171 TaxID=2729726 RepID=UPI0019D2BDE4|nr:hypothetical protein [Halomonas sp. KRD171]
MENWYSLLMRYGDKTTFKLVFESLSMDSLAIHIFFLMGLHGVKSNAKDMSMALLLKIARQRNTDDVFIEWADEFTPYRFSSKKNQFVNKNAGQWRLNDAFHNPHFCSSTVLLSEAEEFLKQEEINKPLDLSEFFDYIISNMRRIDQSVEDRVKANCAKKGKQFPTGLIRQAFESDQYSDELVSTDTSFAEQKQLIKQYLSRNPLPDSVGPMGLPQSKYRYGTYGLGSMEYDAWSRS